jgi:TonB family protein
MSDRRRVAASCVRGWTRIYTWRLPRDAREARRAEVESDLWESAHDPDGVIHGGFHMLVRLLTGVPDDLGWRFEQENTMSARIKLRMAIVGLAAVVGAVWMGAAWSLSQTSRPDVPLPLASAGIGYLPPPPPPPPPPGGEPRSNPESYAQTSYAAANGAKPPIRINDVRPVYPPIAITYDVRGVVVLDATVDRAGRVVSTRIVRSIPVLDHATVNAVRQWQFQPSLVDGVPVPVEIRVSASFNPSKAQ